MSASNNAGEPEGPTNIETRLFINGEFVPSKSGKTFDVINPATEKLTASPFEAGAEDVDLAVDAAKAALPAWSALGGFGRARFFYKLADLVEQANNKFGKLEAVSMGRPIATYSKFAGSFSSWQFGLFGSLNTDHHYRRGIGSWCNYQEFCWEGCRCAW
jgi:aldehyde dehydrogenase (NAD+)